MTLVSRGARVRITGIMKDPAPLPVGLEGTVTTVFNQGTTIEQIAVDWDLIEGDTRPRSLMLLRDDPFEVVTPKTATRRRAAAQKE